MLRDSFPARFIWGCIRRVRLLRSPVGAADRIRVENQASPAPGGELIVISANLWHDWPFHRRLPDRLEAFAQLVEAHGARVVLLQEVMRTADFRSDTWLANRLGMASVYARANGHADAIGFEEGSAVLSGFPVRDVRQTTLGRSVSRFVNRIALGVQLEIECCKLWAFSTHLGLLRAQNGRQLAALQAWIGEVVQDELTVIGGDFNAHEGSEQIQKASQRWTDTYRSLHPAGLAGTHAIRLPWGGRSHTRRLDYIFLEQPDSDWHILETHHLQSAGKPHSDHDAVLTRLQFKPIAI
jgi:endonuclease/exonuclease/phosphatase family metal-dependent hydrolase